MTNRFVRGVGTYICSSCNRRTRPHGGDTSAIYVRLCEECYELAGIENSISDGQALSRETCEYYIERLESRGVNTKIIFPEVWKYLQ